MFFHEIDPAPLDEGENQYCSRKGSGAITVIEERPRRKASATEVQKFPDTWADDVDEMD